MYLSTSYCTEIHVLLTGISNNSSSSIWPATFGGGGRVSSSNTSLPRSLVYGAPIASRSSHLSPSNSSNATSTAAHRSNSRANHYHTGMVQANTAAAMGHPLVTPQASGLSFPPPPPQLRTNTGTSGGPTTSVHPSKTQSSNSSTLPPGLHLVRGNV